MFSKNILFKNFQFKRNIRDIKKINKILKKELILSASLFSSLSTNYKYSFKTNSEWTVIKAPFSEFKKSNAYQPKKLVGQNIKTLGLVAGFKDFQADICLSEIGFY